MSTSRIKPDDVFYTVTKGLRSPLKPVIYAQGEYTLDNAVGILANTGIPRGTILGSLSYLTFKKQIKDLEFLLETALAEQHKPLALPWLRTLLGRSNPRAEDLEKQLAKVKSDSSRIRPKSCEDPSNVDPFALLFGTEGMTNADFTRFIRYLFDEVQVEQTVNVRGTQRTVTKNILRSKKLGITVSDTLKKYIDEKSTTWDTQDLKAFWKSKHPNMGLGFNNREFVKALELVFGAQNLPNILTSHS